MFGEFIKTLRAEKQIGLREFCLATGFDPSNWSKVERGILPPPQEPEKLSRIGAILGIGDDEDKMENLASYAAIGAGKIPPKALEDAELVKRLPIFFRTATGKKPTEDELKILAEILRQS